jgi:hypothetical protein
MIQDSVEGSETIGDISVIGPLGGVGTKQVVEGRPAGDRLADQICCPELGQRLPGQLRWDSGQAGGGREGDIGAGMNAEQPEHPCRGAGQAV